MKFLRNLLILAALAYGGYWLYLHVLRPMIEDKMEMGDKSLKQGDDSEEKSDSFYDR